MIKNVNTGIDASRIQQNLPCFFVNWIEDNKQNYKFFSLRFVAENLYQKLLEYEIKDEFERMNQSLAGLEIFSKTKFQSFSQYGYCLKDGFSTIEEAEEYTLEYYKKHMSLIRQ